jgi:hypothetical protein
VLKLLLTFAAGHAGAQPSQLDIAELDAPLIAVFLERLERDRGDSVVRWVRDVTFAQGLSRSAPAAPRRAWPR